MKDRERKGKDPWVINQKKWYQFFMRGGSAGQFPRNNDSGQLGEPARHAMRQRLLLRLYTEDGIDFKTYCRLHDDDE